MYLAVDFNGPLLSGSIFFCAAVCGYGCDLLFDGEFCVTPWKSNEDQCYCTMTVMDL